MNNRKKHISPLLFYILVSFLSAVVEAGIGLILLLLFVDLSGRTWIAYVFGFFILYSLIIGIGIRVFSSFSEKSQLVKLVGLMPARIVGLFTGSILGYEFADTIGGIIGGILFYFLGRRLGSKLSSRISDSIENTFQVEAVPPIEDHKIPSVKGGFFLVFVLVFPILILLTAFFLQHCCSFGDDNSQHLAIARIVALIISIIMISLPYFLKSVAQKRPYDIKQFVLNQDIAMYILGITFSNVPTILGFILFFMGASIYEMGLFTLLSMLAGSVWTIRELNESRLGG
jgi:hypothetical protein